MVKGKRTSKVSPATGKGNGPVAHGNTKGGGAQ